MRPLVTLLVVATACSASPPADPGPGSSVGTTITAVRSYRFEPASVEVDAGSNVTWVNEDNFVHNVALEGRDEEPLPIGGSAELSFPDPGSFAYVCSLHPQQMKGTVTVT